MMTMLCVYVSGVQTSHFRGCLIGSDMCQPISHFDVLPPESSRKTIFTFFVGIIKGLIFVPLLSSLMTMIMFA